MTLPVKCSNVVDIVREVWGSGEATRQVDPEDPFMPAKGGGGELDLRINDLMLRRDRSNPTSTLEERDKASHKA